MTAQPGVPVIGESEVFMAEKATLGYGSRIICHCVECGNPARVACVLCMQGGCKEHLAQFLGGYECVHQRHYHENDALRMLSETVYVEADDLVFFS
jgi:hypothetical protein